MNQSPEINELAAALSAFQGEVESVSKTDFNPFFKSKYAGLPDVVRAASPILAKHGLSVCQMLGTELAAKDDLEPGGLFDTLTTILMHSSGQWISSEVRLHLTKEDSQGHGSAVTYMRRYAYMAALGLVADEDDDGNAASKPKTVRGYDYNPPVGGGRSIPPDSRKRPPPKVTEISPKRRLLAACAGDKEMAERLWMDAFGSGPEDMHSETEVQLLLSRAEALVAAKPS